uniref:Recep_L_domain domain-containing protein n=1 Tax=Caenorhabditis japonica TaxID=281687 RepID=A0A8R1DLX5_CAEJA
MNWLIFNVVGFLICLNAFNYVNNVNGLVSKRPRFERLGAEIRKVSERRTDNKKFIVSNRGRTEHFVVNRENTRSVHHFLTQMHADTQVGSITFENFKSEKDEMFQRLLNGLHLDYWTDIFDYSHEKFHITLTNCFEGFFHFVNFQMPKIIKREIITINIKPSNCYIENMPVKSFELIHKYGSFAVKLNDGCHWRYWNFDTNHVDLTTFDFRNRDDLKFDETKKVLYLGVKLSNDSIPYFDNLVVRRFNLDKIKEVGSKHLKYPDGCIRFVSPPEFVLLFKSLSKIDIDAENLRLATPFVVNSSHVESSCLDLDDKIDLIGKFGSLSVQIVDNCENNEKVIILDGRQPFDYLVDREDIKYHRGDVIRHVVIRHFTSEEHLEKLDNWFQQMNYYNVTRIERTQLSREQRKFGLFPEITVIGSIVPFFPFPYLKRVRASSKPNSAKNLAVPMFYFRNNSGGDCADRRIYRMLRQSFGQFSVAASRDCECGSWTSSAYFWKHCTTHRGTLEITGYTDSAQLDQYKTIREIRDGQLLIRGANTVTNLNFVSNLNRISCRVPGVSDDELTAVRIEGYNPRLNSVYMRNLNRVRGCEKLVAVNGVLSPSAEKPLWVIYILSWKIFFYLGLDENRLLEETYECELLNDTEGANRNMLIDGEYEEDDVVDLKEIIEEETDSERSDSDCEH